ncbi:TPA: hypothetical protein ACX6PO_002236 [Photobacterium damselae]
MIADAMTSIKAYLYEKAVSPLLGSLIISWCAWNYKFLLMLVSGLSFPDKLRYINILYSSAHDVYFHGILLPFLTSMAYLFLFPFPAQWVYQFSLKRQQVLNELKNKVQENELLTLEQSKMIRNQLIDVEKKSDEEIERQNRLIKTRDDKIVELQSTIDEKNREREELNKDILKLIESYTASKNGVTDNDAHLINQIIDKYKIEDKQQSEAYVQELLNRINRIKRIKINQNENENSSMEFDFYSKFDFYYSASKQRQQQYIKVLSKLYQHANVNINDFEMDFRQLRAIMNILIKNKVVTTRDSRSEPFVITNEGRQLYELIRNSNRVYAA